MHLLGKENRDLIEKGQIKGLNLKVVDIGCGQGFVTKEFADFIGRNNLYVGVDIDNKALKNAKNLNSYSNVFTANAFKIPFKKNSFDVAIFTMLVEHVRNDSKLFSSIFNVLKKDGVVLFSTIIRKPKAFYFYRRDGHFVLDPTHVNEYSDEKSIVKKLEESGFEIEYQKTKPIKRSIVDLFSIFAVKLGLLDLINRVYSNQKFYKIRNFLSLRAPGFYRFEAILRKCK